MTTGWTAAVLAGRGWEVFPCSGKIPLTTRGVKDATADVKTVKAWWHRWPSANVAIATGAGFVVVDIDGEQGSESLRELQDRHEPLPATLSASTGGGGLHLYFRTLERFGNTAGKLGPGIDTRGTGGYVIAPPSMHPSGRRYEWARRAEMSVAPPWLAKLLSPPPRPPRSPMSEATPMAGACSAYGQAALEREAARVASAVEGTRNHELNRAAFALGQLVAGGELDEHLVRTHPSVQRSRAGCPNMRSLGETAGSARSTVD